MKIKIAIVLILLIIQHTTLAQNIEQSVCISNLSSANTLYEKAQFTEAIALIEPCIKSGGLNKNLEDAYRILALCYHQNGNFIKRDEAILKLLKINPKYQLFPLNDPKDFTISLNTFNVESNLFLGIKTGFNFSLPNVTKAYSIKPATIETASEPGQFLGINIDYFLKKKTVSINGWASSSSLSFTQNLTFNDIEKIKYKQTLNFWDIGLEMKYYPLKNKKFIPYLGLGINNQILRNALSNTIYTNSYLGTKTESSRDMKKDKLANKNLLNAIFDMGVTAKAGKGVFGLGVQYAHCFSNSLNTDNRYNNIEYILTNQWVDSDIKLNYVNVYASYTFPVLWRVYK